MKSRVAIAVVVVFVIVFGIALMKNTQNVRSPENSNGEVSSSGAQERYIDAVSYACNAGKNINASYYESPSSVAADGRPIPGGRVVLTLSDGRVMSLPQTISADGIRYANDDDLFVFWSKGDGAIVIENNQEKNFVGCVRVAPLEQGSDLSRVYQNGEHRYTIRTPEAFGAGRAYAYDALGTGKGIIGIKFNIPASMATGTNLSSDSYLSVEKISKTATCSAALFLGQGSVVKNVSDNGTEYSMGTLSDAAAGNRYDETVYAIPGINSCIAVRYFIHYGNIQNYPEGVVREFDEAALVREFDRIRHTLVIAP